jgi:ribonuclease HI
VSRSSELRSSLGHTDSLLRWFLAKAGGWCEALLHTPTGEQFKHMIHLDFKATNNMAEYEAFIFGLSTALSLGV